MREPELETPLGREAWALYQEEIAPRIKDIDGPMGYAIKGMMMGIESQLPDFFESLDQDQELQAEIMDRMRAALVKIDADDGSQEGTEDGRSETDLADAFDSMVIELGHRGWSWNRIRDRARGVAKEAESGPAV